MEYLKEDQILLYEELYAKPIKQDDRLTQATIRFRENIKLANHIASKFSVSQYSILDKEDIYQCAYEGLWKACLNFDESKGFQFSTYAVPVIRGQIQRAVRDDNPVHIPRWHKDLRYRILQHNFNLPLSDEEIDILVSEGEFSEEQIREYEGLDVTSLDAYILDKDDGITLGDAIPDDRYGIKDELDSDSLERVIDTILNHLKPDHRDMIEEWLYATIYDEGITQIELARKYGISQAQVSRVITSTIRVANENADKIRLILGY